MLNWIPRALVISAFTAVTSFGCLYSPVGTNNSPAVFPTPGADDGKVEVTYKPKASDAAKVTFVVRDHTDIKLTDDSPDDGFDADLDVSKLSPGLYVVDVTVDDAEDPEGHISILVTGEGGASGASAPAAKDTGATKDTGASGTTSK